MRRSPHLAFAAFLTVSLGSSGVFAADSRTQPAGSPSTPSSHAGRAAESYASQRHFESVQTLLQEVRWRKGIEVRTLGQLALWIETYARRLDRLPLRRVDEDLQDYSAEVARLLRQMAAAYKSYGIRSGARQAQYFRHGTVTVQRAYDTYGGYGYGGYTGYGNQYVEGQRRRVTAEERARGATSAVEIWQAIDNATSEIRREMTRRYDLEF